VPLALSLSHHNPIALQAIAPIKGVAAPISRKFDPVNDFAAYQTKFEEPPHKGTPHSFKVPKRLAAKKQKRLVAKTPKTENKTSRRMYRRSQSPNNKSIKSTKYRRIGETKRLRGCLESLNGVETRHNVREIEDWKNKSTSFRSRGLIEATFSSFVASSFGSSTPLGFDSASLVATFELLVADTRTTSSH
jgi:hypothetical protein